MPPARRIAVALAAAGGLLAGLFLFPENGLRVLIGAQPSDALWAIVDQCVGKSGPYCACPAFRESCCTSSSLADSEVVWALTPEFVAIRDMRECGCPSSFVSGLAMPRARISGLEAAHLPEGIWPFAWGTASQVISDPRQIALVINPEGSRTQDQLHIHISRLSEDGRQLLDDPPTASPSLQVVSLSSLDQVFRAAGEIVGAAKRKEYGILIAAASSPGTWKMLLMHDGSPEGYTIAFCSSTDSPDSSPSRG